MGPEALAGDLVTCDPLRAALGAPPKRGEPSASERVKLFGLPPVAKRRRVQLSRIDPCRPRASSSSRDALVEAGDSCDRGRLTAFLENAQLREAADVENRNRSPSAGRTCWSTRQDHCRVLPSAFPEAIASSGDVRALVARRAPRAPRPARDACTDARIPDATHAEDLVTVELSRPSVRHRRPAARPQIPLRARLPWTASPRCDAPAAADAAPRGARRRGSCPACARKSSPGCCRRCRSPCATRGGVRERLWPPRLCRRRTCRTCRRGCRRAALRAYIQQRLPHRRVRSATRTASSSAAGAPADGGIRRGRRRCRRGTRLGSRPQGAAGAAPRCAARGVRPGRGAGVVGT